MILLNYKIGNKIYLNGEYVIVNSMSFSNKETEEDIKDLAKQIIDVLYENDLTHVAFDIISEGLPYNQISATQRIIRLLIEKYKKSKLEFFYIFSASPCFENINFYKSHCQRFDWIEIPVNFFNWYEVNGRRVLLEQLALYNEIDTSPRIKKKKFVCYNRNVKAHRLFFTTEIINRNLLDDSYLSNYFEFEIHEFILNSIHEILPKYFKNVIETLYKHREKFPLDLGLGSIKNHNHDPSDFSKCDFDHYNETYFALITESKFALDNYNIPNRLTSDLSLDCYLFSEKTYKFIAGKKPFLLAGLPGSLAMLRKMGYKTFSPYIDENYDTIQNDEDRFYAIMNEVERLCNFSEQEWLEWQKGIEEILIHNFNVLRTSGDVLLSYRPKY